MVGLAFRQKIHYRRNENNQICVPTSYAHVHRELPPPPRGHSWHYNHHTKEWRVLPKHLLPREHDVVTEASKELHKREHGDGTDGTNKKQQQAEPPKVDPSQYYRHTVRYGDTFQGICLRYGITPTQLRQANTFSGSNLLLAPSVLVIPVDKATVVERPFDDAEFMIQKEHKLRTVLHAMSDGWFGTTAISPVEAKAYLEMNGWNVDEAIANAKEDAMFEAGRMNHTAFEESDEEDFAC